MSKGVGVCLEGMVGRVDGLVSDLCDGATELDDLYRSPGTEGR